MSQALRVFISFTDPDSAFVRRLMERLQTQGFEPWNYQSDEGEIRGGQDIGKVCRSQIDCSEVFIPVISRNCFQSEWTRLEIDYAFDHPYCGDQLRMIIPIVSHDVFDKQVPWPGNYARLRQRICRVVDFDSSTSRSSRLSLEEVVMRVCHDVGRPYRPPLPEDPRLPFIRRFEDEVISKRPRHDDRAMGIYCGLMRVLMDFGEAFSRGDFVQATRRMRFFCTLCEHDYPHERFYYAYIVVGICEVLSGDLDAAEKTFRLLLDHPQVEESTFGALGLICQRRQDYAGALEFYSQAHQKCADDPAAKIGVAINAVLSGSSYDLDLETLLREAEQLPTVTTEDRVAIQSAKAFTLAGAGRVSAAIVAFEQLVESGTADAATVVHFARLLQSTHQLRAAVQLVERFQHRFDDLAFVQQRAYLLVFDGQLSRAAECLQRLVQREPHCRQHRMDLARVLKSLNRSERIAAVCQPIFSSGRFPLPQTANDFYLDGMANWLLGNRDRAEYDFTRSGFAENLHYRYLT